MAGVPSSPPRARSLAATWSPISTTPGGVRAYGVADLRVLGRYDWRLSSKNVWKVEQMLIDHPHRKVSLPRARERVLRRWYKMFRAANDDIKPVDYADRDRWTELPAECLAAEGRLPRRPR